MPRLQDIVSRLWEPAATEQPPLAQVLVEKALFTAREAAVGFVIGALVGIAIGVVFHFSNLMRRGFQPYVVGSQTVPILAIAPMVVIWLGGQGLPVWMPVAVIWTGSGSSARKSASVDAPGSSTAIKLPAAPTSGP